MSTSVKLPEVIRIRGARVHNLKNISLDLPRHQLIVITGKSGSGKSSLAFDTIYAEGQRRYVESLSTYARQFIRGFEKPDIDAIEGLSPPIAIDQRGIASNPRSTVGTMTEIYDHLRLLYATVGVAHCPDCQQPIERQTLLMFIERIRRAVGNSDSVTILLPFRIANKRELQTMAKLLQRQQWSNIIVDEEPFETGSSPSLSDRWIGKTIEVEVGSLTVSQVNAAETIHWVEGFLHQSKGALVARVGSIRLALNTSLYCEQCDRTLAPFEPRHFSFNSPYGACEECGGLGTKWIVDPSLVVPNPSLTLSEGAIRPLSRLLPHHGGAEKVLEELSLLFHFPLDLPVKNFSNAELDCLYHGSGQSTEQTPLAGGMVGYLHTKYITSDSEYVKSEIERTMRLFPCPSCDGRRLKREALWVTVAGLRVSEVVALPFERLREFLTKLLSEKKEKNGNHAKVHERVVKMLTTEMITRIDHLIAVGLDYLTLDRSVTTLAGGEVQRIRLATQLQSRLVDLVYILDEPSIGLHQRDNARLINTLKQLRDLGNTVIVVEHDAETIRSADTVVDMGPGAGTYGGEVIAHGSVRAIEESSRSITGAYLSGRSSIAIPPKRRSGNGRALTVHRASAYNLKDVTISLPLGSFVVITGVSGSGKSTLIDDILAKSLLHHFYHAKELPAAHERITGVEYLDKVIMIDQSPIGRTPRSNPATYTGIFTLIRDLFIGVPEAKVKGLKAGHFSFNVRGGRCEECQGGGWITVSMQFLPDMTVECDTCEGKRYLPEILNIHWREKSIAEVLELTVQEALHFFEPSSDWDTRLLIDKLSILDRVGLGYLKLGQPATTLSGGEAQRIKLATELSRRSTGRTLYILDEPTTGLHSDDIQKLLIVLQELVNLGNSVLVIEHNLDVIKCADWVVDLGPDGGEKGGSIVAEGTPEHVATVAESWTGQYLRPIVSPAHRERHNGNNGSKSKPRS